MKQQFLTIVALVTSVFMSSAAAQSKYVSAIDFDTAWRVSTADKIYRTDDGGASWELASGLLKQVSAVDKETAWGVNANDNVYWSDNGGESWTKVAGLLKQVSAVDKNTAWAVNANDNVYRSDNGGASWTKVSGLLKQVSAVDKDTAWGVNANDNVYWSDNGGASWTKVAGLLKQVSAVDKDKAWGVNANGKIYRSDNGGSSWQAAAHAAKTVKLTKLYCTDTTEAGEDEIYINVNVDGTEHRLPGTGYKRMDDGALDTWALNAVYTVKDKMIITVMEDDDSSGNDTIGTEVVIVLASENGEHSVSLDEGAKYTLSYEVSDAATDLSTGFTMAVMSDPQYSYCHSEYCKNNAGDSAKANEWHSSSIELVEAASTNFMGVIVNGDLTHTMDDEQLDNYRKNYANKFVTYPGLGNHDYENYTPARNDSIWCGDVGIASSKHYCAKEMVDYIVEVARANPAIQDFDYTEGRWNRDGSLAYYFDIGDYRFIQLQNHPAFENEWSVYMSNRAGHEDYTIKPSLDWLRTVLAKSGDKT